MKPALRIYFSFNGALKRLKDYYEFTKLRKIQVSSNFPWSKKYFKCFPFASSITASRSIHLPSCVFNSIYIFPFDRLGVIMRQIEKIEAIAFMVTYTSKSGKRALKKTLVFIPMAHRICIFADRLTRPDSVKDKKRTPWVLQKCFWTDDYTSSILTIWATTSIENILNCHKWLDRSEQWQRYREYFTTSNSEGERSHSQPVNKRNKIDVSRGSSQNYGSPWHEGTGVSLIYNVLSFMVLQYWWLNYFY